MNISPMLAKPFNERVLRKWSKLYAQPKLDGDRCIACCYPRYTPSLISRQGNTKVGLHHIQQQLERVLPVRDAMSEALYLDGELYVHGMDHAVMHGIINRTYDCGAKAEIEYHIFDVVSDAPFSERLLELYKLDEAIKGLDITHVKVVPTDDITTEELSDCLNTYLDAGYEGIILRNGASGYEEKRTSNLMKYKPSYNDVYTIIDTYPEVAQDGTIKDRLGGFVLEDMGNNRFRCGSGSLLTHEARRDFWKHRDELPGCLLKVYYQELTNNRIPRHPVCTAILNWRS